MEIDLLMTFKRKLDLYLKRFVGLWENSGGVELIAPLNSMIYLKTANVGINITNVSAQEMEKEIDSS